MPMRVLPRSGPRRPRPSVGEDNVVYAVGDIHGRPDLLDRLLDRIRADAANRRARRKTVVFLGDYVDRGPDSRGVIDRLLAQGEDGLRYVCLKGNHEDAMLRFLEGGSAGYDWLGFGGAATLQAYGIDMPRIGAGDWLEPLRRQMRDRLPRAHIGFLESLPLTHEEGDYFFVHAGIRPGVPLHRQDPDDLLWIREPFLRSMERFDKVVVHGHTIAERPVVAVNRIGIDTGAVMTGVLTGVALHGTQRRFIQTRRDRAARDAESWSG